MSVSAFALQAIVCVLLIDQNVHLHINNNIYCVDGTTVNNEKQWRKTVAIEIDTIPDQTARKQLAGPGHYYHIGE